MAVEFITERVCRTHLKPQTATERRFAKNGFHIDEIDTDVEMIETADKGNESRRTKTLTPKPRD